jgi:hypothetical protein
MAMPEMDAVKDAALKYDKPTLARLAQSGQLSPTLAVMAGMMRDRIVQSEMKPPSPPTVAEEVMQPMGQRMGLGAIAPVVNLKLLNKCRLKCPTTTAPRPRFRSSARPQADV